MQKETAKKAFKSAIFIFRRDLRLDDNTGLLKALQLAEKVYPVFIFDPRQIHQARNDYFSNSCVQFMCDSLSDLDLRLKERGSQLNYVYGEYPGIISDLIQVTKADLLAVNMDYTKFSKDRDQQIRATCMESKVQFVNEEDICLLTKKQSMSTRKAGDEFFKKFTPYYNAVSGITIRRPIKCDSENFAQDVIAFGKNSANKVIVDGGKQYYEENKHMEVKGGRKFAFQILTNLEKLKNYEEVRNFPSKNTSKLSAYNKFGCVSIREVYYAAKAKMAEKSEAFVRQLYWRDFYYYIGEYYPHIWNGPMKVNYAGIKWWKPEHENFLQKWQEGQTGCPIVDASMRHLNKTGYMPNRNRMIVSNYLVKDLHINWQEGEKYFATKLADYDPCMNNGGWQWSAGCGVDSQPYFRIFNPKLQSEKVDKQCVYIKKWVPELKEVENGHVHDWETAHEYKEYKKIDYPAPLVIHSEQKETCIQLYVQALESAQSKGIDTNSYKDTDGDKAKKKKSAGSDKSTDKADKVLKARRTKKQDFVDDSEESQKPKKVKRVNRISNYGSIGKGKE